MSCAKGVLFSLKLFAFYYTVSHSVLEGHPHSVRFTMNPPPDQRRNEMISHYSINCISESNGEGMTANGTGLEPVTLTFVPSTYYTCSVSMSTVCEVILNLGTMQLLTGKLKPCM